MLNYNIAIPEEYYKYIQNNAKFAHLYEELFKPNLDFSKILTEHKEYAKEIEFLNKILLEMYQQQQYFLFLNDRNRKSRSDQDI
jgi:hypothetical protein